MEVSTSANHIPFSAVWGLFLRAPHTDDDSVDCVLLDMGEIDFHFTETVVFTFVESYVFEVGFVAQVTNFDGSEFEELGMVALGTFQQFGCAVHF